MNFDDILLELEFRSGEMVDLTKSSQLSILNEILIEQNNGDIALELIRNLQEGINDGDNNRKCSRRRDRIAWWCETA